MTHSVARVYNENLAISARIIDETLAKEYNIMSEDLGVMSTREAAEYLQMPLSTFKYHVERKHLQPRIVGRTRLYTRQQLDEFKAALRKPGRPKKPRDANHGLDRVPPNAPDAP